MRKSYLFYALVAFFSMKAAVAAEARPFSLEAFHEAQNAGQSILVDVHADWCPICKAQEPTLKAIESDPTYAKLVVFTVDFDKQTEEKKALGVRQQSTLIAFAGSNEKGRNVGVTDAAAIRNLASSALVAAK